MYDSQFLVSAFVKFCNSSCLDTAATIEYINRIDRPWMAFKVLATGAIHPRAGFRYARESGADLIHVGMFDYQLREDVIVTRKILSGELKRQRPWRA